MAKRSQWLHGELDRVIVDGLVKDKADGTYLVRTRPVANEYVLCVVYKTRPSHHLIKKQENGIFCINNKEYGQNETLDALISTLQKPVPGWPVPLSNPIPPSSAVLHEEPEEDPEDARREQQYQREQQAQRELQQREHQEREKQERERVAREKRELEDQERRHREEVAKESARRQQQERDAEEEAQRRENERHAAQDAQRREKEKHDEEARHAAATRTITQDTIRRRQHEEEERKAYQEHVKTELHQTKTTLSIGGSGGTSSTDNGLTDLTRSLARTIIKMGNRMTALEQQVADLNKTVAEIKRGGRF